MDTVIQVQVKSVYGVDRIYPINQKAHQFAALLNRKTLTKADLDKIKGMGFIIEWVPITIS